VTAIGTGLRTLHDALSHHGMTIYTGPAGPGYLGGAEANDLTARFADGTISIAIITAGRPPPRPVRSSGQ